MLKKYFFELCIFAKTKDLTHPNQDENLCFFAEKNLCDCIAKRSKTSDAMTRFSMQRYAGTTID